MENKEDFFQRFFMAKNLQNAAQNEMRYLNYIQNVDTSSFSEMCAEVQDRILKKCLLPKCQDKNQIKTICQEIKTQFELV